jgi:Flp pilus assembly CpaF family ATPase
VPLAAVRSQMLGAVDLVVHIVRAGGARRRVAAVAEVVADDGRVGVRPLADAERVVAGCGRPPRRPDREAT